MPTYLDYFSCFLDQRLLWTFLPIDLMFMALTNFMLLFELFALFFQINLNSLEAETDILIYIVPMNYRQ